MRAGDTMQLVPVPRRTIAALLAFAALIPIVATRFAASGSGGGSASLGEIEVNYSYGYSTGDERAVALGLALLLAAGAAAVWAGRDRRVVAAGALGCAAALALTAVAVAGMRSDSVTAVEDRAIRPGMSPDQVEAIAGRPAGSGEGVTRSGRTLECAVYLDADFPKLFCFDGGRLVEGS